MEDSSNILGFSMFNTSHPFYPEFVRSLNMSWRENCDASTYPGPAVSLRPCPRHTPPTHPPLPHTDTSRAPSGLGQLCSEPLGAPLAF